MSEFHEKENRVVQFKQSETRAKKFRNDYPISEELRGTMISVVARGFTNFAYEKFYTPYEPILKEFVAEFNLEGQKQDTLLHNLFWWRLLYDTNLDSESCIEEYIDINKEWLKDIPILMSWLREWDKAVPKFYYVVHKYNDRVHMVIDILEEDMLDVIVYDPLATPPKQGEIMVGTLIPLGDSLYFPITDFYHFNYDARKEIGAHFRYSFDEHLKKSSMYEAFIHVFSLMLHMERFLVLESENKATSNKSPKASKVPNHL